MTFDRNKEGGGLSGRHDLNRTGAPRPDRASRPARRGRGSRGARGRSPWRGCTPASPAFTSAGNLAEEAQGRGTELRVGEPRDRASWSAWMLAAMSRPRRKPAIVPSDADRGAGDQEHPHDRAAGRAHGAQDRDVARLVLHEHDQPGDDVERRHQHDQRQDQEHHVALDLECGEEGAVSLAPVGQHDRPLRRLLDGEPGLVDPVGIVEEDLDDVTSPSRLK